MSSTGPSIRGVCRVINQNSCGSGSICGHYNGGSLVLTNAHVAGSQVGRKVQVEIESLGMRRFTGEVIRAAYSNRVIADWAVIHIPGFQDIEPVYLSKFAPASGESMYTKGFPRCRAHNGTDIAQHQVLSNGVLLWLPDAISGQSGSGVWGDSDGLQKALLTWSWTSGRRQYGAGQLTSEIYRQNRDREIRGFAMMPGLKPLNEEYDLDAVNRDGAGDPVVEEGFYSAPIEAGIQDLPIWYEDQVTEPPVDPGDGGDCGELRKQFTESLRRIGDAIDKEIDRFSSGSEGGGTVDPDDPDAIDDTFGL